MPLGKSMAVYTCKACRKKLFLSEAVIPHEQGDALFNKKRPDHRQPHSECTSHFIETYTWMGPLNEIEGASDCGERSVSLIWLRGQESSRARSAQRAWDPTTGPVRRVAQTTLQQGEMWADERPPFRRHAVLVRHMGAAGVPGREEQGGRSRLGQHQRPEARREARQVNSPRARTVFSAYVPWELKVAPTWPASRSAAGGTGPPARCGACTSPT